MASSDFIKPIQNNHLDVVVALLRLMVRITKLIIKIEYTYITEDIDESAGSSFDSSRSSSQGNQRRGRFKLYCRRVGLQELVEAF